jgi:F420-dependent oxidoreductase-like protein
MTIPFGVIVPQGWRQDLVTIPDPVEKYETMTRVAQEAERLGYHSIWLYDHFHTTPAATLETSFECWISTAALARDTHTIRIGQMVTCNNYRNPALLAKMASTVDVLSHGRLDFGIGAGWYEEEYRAYGYPFPDGPERLRQLDEAMQIILAMWGAPYATFAGRHYTVQGAINEPKGVQQPHPPIWLGGGGEKVTLKLAARYADACNVVAIDPDVCQHKFGVLKEHCDKLGRDYNAILKSGHAFVYLLDDGETVDDALAAMRRIRGYEELTREALLRGTIVGGPAEVTTRLQALVAAGVEYFIVYFRNHLADGGSLRRFAAEVLPSFA